MPQNEAAKTPIEHPVEPFGPDAPAAGTTGHTAPAADPSLRPRRRCTLPAVLASAFPRERVSRCAHSSAVERHSRRSRRPMFPARQLHSPTPWPCRDPNARIWTPPLGASSCLGTSASVAYRTARLVLDDTRAPTVKVAERERL